MSISNVAAFPLYRRRKLVSGITRVLGAKHGEEATVFWRETAKQLLQQLRASGIAQEAAEEEVRSLLYMVLQDMHRGTATAGAPAERK